MPLGAVSALAWRGIDRTNTSSNVLNACANVRLRNSCEFVQPLLEEKS